MVPVRHGRLAAVLAIATVTAACPGAWANGRPPATNGVYLHPGDANAVYVRSTFGLLVSRDGGCSFRWICERAIGYGGEFDPKYAIATDGTMFATTFTGLRVSRDGGCTWVTAISDLWIDALDIAPTGDVWVATAESAGMNNVFRSTDNGLTFAPRGLASATVWWKSLEVARSNPARIYVTGYQVAPEARAFLQRTDDTGATWTEKPLPAELIYGSTPLVLVAAVDPTNPDHLLLTSTGANPPAGDRLYRSTDGGDTVTEVLATIDPVRDVVFRASGAVLVATVAGGTFEAQGMGAFAPLGTTTPGTRPPQLACLAERPGGELIGCGANWQPDFMAVGRATDPLAFEKLFRFVELAGTVACPAGTPSQTECDPMWPALAQQFGVTGPPAVCGGVTDGEQVDGPMPRKPTGCCDASDAAPSWLAVLVGAGLLRRRRRAQSPSASRQLG